MALAPPLGSGRGRVRSEARRDHRCCSKGGMMTWQGWRGHCEAKKVEHSRWRLERRRGGDDKRGDDRDTPHHGIAFWAFSTCRVWAKVSQPPVRASPRQPLRRGIMSTAPQRRRQGQRGEETCLKPHSWLMSASQTGPRVTILGGSGFQRW